MKINVGSTDRLTRIIAGAVLLVLPFLLSFESGLLTALSMLVGVVLLVTGATRSCPAYRMLGVDTSAGSKSS